MDIIIPYGINSKTNIFRCSFPDCNNESTCQCSKCFNLYCHSHLQIHFGFCNNLNDIIKDKNDLGYFETFDSMQNIIRM